MMVNLDHVANVSYILAKKCSNSKNDMTVGKKISRPSKPDQAGPFCFIRLEVMILQRQPSRWWLLSIRYREAVA